MEKLPGRVRFVVVSEDESLLATGLTPAQLPGIDFSRFIKDDGSNLSTCHMPDVP